MLEAARAHPADLSAAESGHGEGYEKTVEANGAPQLRTLAHLPTENQSGSQV